MPYSGGSSGPITINTVQTPDSYYLSTDPLSNAIVLGEASDAGFDFATTQKTDPTLVIHSHNQNTTQWIGAYHNATNGVVESGTNSVLLRSGSVNHLAADTEGVRINTTDALGFTSGNVASTAVDAFFSREAAATIQMGADVNGAAVNQTFKAHDGITGSDILGAKLTLASGLGTGAAVSGPLTINRQLVKASGSTAQTYGQGFVVAPSKILSNTSATAQTVATISTTTLSSGGVTFHYCVSATSGTAADADTGSIHISWNNVGGTVAATAGTIINSVQSNSSGTLAATPTVTVATNVVSIKLTPTWATIVPTTVTYFGTFMVYGQDSVIPA